ncbi:response regulator [Paradesertivirga mongoliensis]|uniref:Response regulator n=1 Tax=Paradesertivirga mongoliensis TaxID=2100740 RepID=A0ABW4ZPA4_9SPHI|nr:response regulator [Pedobacter mongoliensis]
MNSKNIILLVDDDELDVISVERSLKKLDQDYELFTAYNGIEALEILKSQLEEGKGHLPDVILLDLNMPKMNGIEFLKVLRGDDKLKHLKVFVMTTSGEEADRKATEQLGVSGYLIKPLNFNNNTKRSDSMDGFVQFHLRKILASKGL